MEIERVTAGSGSCPCHSSPPQARHKIVRPQSHFDCEGSADLTERSFRIVADGPVQDIGGQHRLQHARYFGKIDLGWSRR
jgi:hypothetical protein